MAPSCSVTDLAPRRSLGCTALGPHLLPPRALPVDAAARRGGHEGDDAKNPRCDFLSPHRTPGVAVGVARGRVTLFYDSGSRETRLSVLLDLTAQCCSLPSAPLGPGLRRHDLVEQVRRLHGADAVVAPFHGRGPWGSLQPLQTTALRLTAAPPDHSAGTQSGN